MYTIEFRIFDFVYFYALANGFKYMTRCFIRSNAV